jgi:hypothetical protein
VFGGTGQTTFTAGAVLLGAGNGPIATVTPGTSGNILRSNGSSWVSENVPDGLAALVDAGWHRWNGETDASTDWPALVKALPYWSAHSCAWAEQLGIQADLASRLLGFARKIR